MNTVREIANFLQTFAPHYLAEDWDNVGLLVGDYQQSANRVMTCLTITPKSAAEAIEQKADLIVAHHPLPFRSLKRITTETTEGRLLLNLISANVSIYSPHTAFDSALTGINQSLAEGLSLQNVGPLVQTVEDDPQIGTGRCGVLKKPLTLNELAKTVQQFLKIEGLKVVGQAEKKIQKIAVACGSAGELLPEAIKMSCDALVLGETSFHTCLSAEAQEIALILPGHYATERFAVEMLADRLATEFPSTQIWASREESDPLRWMT